MDHDSHSTEHYLKRSEAVDYLKGMGVTTADARRFMGFGEPYIARPLTNDVISIEKLMHINPENTAPNRAEWEIDKNMLAMTQHLYEVTGEREASIGFMRLLHQESALRKASRNHIDVNGFSDDLRKSSAFDIYNVMNICLIHQLTPHDAESVYREQLASGRTGSNRRGKELLPSPLRQCYTERGISRASVDEQSTGNNNTHERLREEKHPDTPHVGLSAQEDTKTMSQQERLEHQRNATHQGRGHTM